MRKKSRFRMRTKWEKNRICLTSSRNVGKLDPEDYRVNLVLGEEPVAAPETDNSADAMIKELGFYRGIL